MGKRERERGKAYERELARYFTSEGYDCHRSAQYCGNTGDAADVVGLPGIHIEAKRQEALRLQDWIDQAENDSKAAAELRRLMYVAFTRAEDELFITGSFDGSPETTREGSKIISSDAFLPGKLGEKMENSEDCFKSPKTIYHLLQPFLSRYVVDEKASEHAPFDFELIKEIARNEVGKSENKTYRKNCTEEKRALLEKLSAEYDKAEKISTKKNRSIYISPSLLHAADEETHRWRAKGGAVYKIDEILKGISSEDSEEEGADDERKRFGSNNFGNIAHAFMEALFNDDKKGAFSRASGLS